jgi:hypothetical protein
MGGLAAHRRTVLEAVAGAGADEQQVRQPGVEIDRQVAVRAVLILADPRPFPTDSCPGGRLRPAAALSIFVFAGFARLWR